MSNSVLGQGKTVHLASLCLAPPPLIQLLINRTGSFLQKGGIISVAHLKIKYTGNGISVLARPSTGVEIFSLWMYLLLRIVTGPPPVPTNGKVVGVGDVDAFKTVQDTCWRVTANNNIILSIVRALNTGEVGCHTRAGSPENRVQVCSSTENLRALTTAISFLTSPLALQPLQPHQASPCFPSWLHE